MQTVICKKWNIKVRGDKFLIRLVLQKVCRRHKWGERLFVRRLITTLNCVLMTFIGNWLIYLIFSRIYDFFLLFCSFCSFCSFTNLQGLSLSLHISCQGHELVWLVLIALTSYIKLSILRCNGRSSVSSGSRIESFLYSQDQHDAMEDCHYSIASGQLNALMNLSRSLSCVLS